MFKNDRSIHWTRCPLCLLKWLAAVTIKSTVLVVQDFLHSDWSQHGQCFIFEVPSLHKVAPRGCLWMSAQSFARFVPSSSGTCCHLPRSHSGPTPSASHSGVSDGQWQWWRWCLGMWDPQPKTPKLGWWVMGATLWSHSRYSHLRCGKLLRWKSISFVR